VIVACILKLDLRGFPPTKLVLYAIANKLLADKGGKLMGINWPDRFIAYKIQLKICWTCVYDR
jgi:hypothetical protein